MADQAARDPAFEGRCFLCGHPCKPGHLFCVAHDDLGGDPPAGRRKR